MMKYQLNSKRKQYYLCQICSAVFITAKAIREHYSKSHPGLDCNVPEDSVPELETFDDTPDNMSNLNMFNLNSLKEADYITLTNSFGSLSSVMPLPAMSNGNALQLYNNPLQAYGYQFTTQPSTSMIGVKSAPAASNPTNNHATSSKSSHSSHRNSMAMGNHNNHQNHNDMGNSGGQISCDICKKKFSTIYNKKRHEDMFHGNMTMQNQQPPSNKCSMCNKVFNSIYNKKRHEATHKPLDQRLKFKCQYPNCTKEYTTVSILKIHMKKVHNIELAGEQ